MAACAVTEDFEDQRSAIQYFDTDMALKVALLGRRQGLVEDDGLRVLINDQVLDFIGLARTDEERGIGSLAARDDARDGRVASRFGEQSKLIKGGVEGRTRPQIDPHQHDPWRNVAGALERL